MHYAIFLGYFLGISGISFGLSDSSAQKALNPLNEKNLDRKWMGNIPSVQKNQASFEQKKERNQEGGFRLLLSGKASFAMIFGQNKTNYTVLFTPPSSSGIFNLSALFGSGEKIYSHAAKSQFNVNNSQFMVRAEQPFFSNEGTFAVFIALTGDPDNKQSVREIAAEIDTFYGTLVLGNTKGVENRAVAGPVAFFRGTGGTDGAMSRFLNPTTGVYMFPSMKGDTGVATKIIFFSPNFGDIKAWGAVQFGLSYTPNTSMVGEAKMNTAFNSKDPLKASFDMHSFAQSMRYSLERELFGMALSFVRIHGRTRPAIPQQPLLNVYQNNSWDVAMNAHYGPWCFGVEYIYNGRSGFLKNDLPGLTPYLISDLGVKEALPTMMYSSSSSGKNYTLNTGLGYVLKNQWGVSLAYLRTGSCTGFLQPNGEGKPIKAKGTAWVLSADQSLVDGVDCFVEVAISYKMSNPAWPYMGTAGAALTKLPFPTTPSNSAAAILSGLKVKF
ncbi:hypothetical protein [Holospora curviuscula]|uniref:Porin n=1 Tax=Holospora curviuscula TaxID=1082868 RepID=A0A2S5RE69_9PROT|nr:hypothetical protein [Holospora curviuscula]PPE05604.1 hypothetical protein HCUR_00252 [Holospora curviuscula]